MSSEVQGDAVQGSELKEDIPERRTSEPRTLRIAHLSDIHFGLENNRALDWVKQEISEQKPDAVAITGDLTMRARHREFAAATLWINSLDAPVTVEVGNHDMPYFNPIERFFAPYRRFHGMREKVEREIDALLPSSQSLQSPVGSLENYQRAVSTLTGQLLGFNAPTIGLVVAFIGLVVGLAVQQRRNELAITRSRGGAAGPPALLAAAA